MEEIKNTGKNNKKESPYVGPTSEDRHNTEMKILGLLNGYNYTNIKMILETVERCVNNTAYVTSYTDDVVKKLLHE